MYESRGFTYKHIQKAVLSVIVNPFFFVRWVIFFGLPAFLELILKRR
jgi:hypothetical protein